MFRGKFIDYKAIILKLPLSMFIKRGLNFGFNWFAIMKLQSPLALCALFVEYPVFLLQISLAPLSQFDTPHWSLRSALSRLLIHCTGGLCPKTFTLF